jgi:hypothetical protein
MHYDDQSARPYDKDVQTTHHTEDEDEVMHCHEDAVYDEATFRLELRHADPQRRKTAELADEALRRLARLRAANERSSFEDMYRRVFDEDLMQHDLSSSDDLLKAAARDAVHHLVGMFTRRWDDWYEREVKPMLPPARQETEQERRTREIIQARAEWARAHPNRPRRRLRWPPPLLKSV